jgi:hypothetical protein
MEQRQLRVGDTLDDYCPRERRLTTHAIVAIVGDEVKQTRCAGCETEHVYRHGKVPRPRKKPESPAALYGQVAAGAPKRVVHEPAEVALHAAEPGAPQPDPELEAPAAAAEAREATSGREAPADEGGEDGGEAEAEGPVHRPLIRASLPRPEGQAPPPRPIPEFTIRQPGGGRPGRFRPRHQRGMGGQQSFGNRSNGNMGGGPQRGGGQRPAGGRPHHQGGEFHHGRHQGPRHKRSK